MPMEISTDISKFSRPDLITWVFDHCVNIPEHRLQDLINMECWCERELGDQRPGNIIGEAMDGWLDFHEGDWCIIHDILHRNGNVVWFSSKSDMVRFQMSWF